MRVHSPVQRTPKPQRSRVPAGRVWLGIFGIWGILLSGAFAQLVGSPGVIQGVRLSGLLETRQLQLATLETELAQLRQEAARLEGCTLAQHREIRRILGYAASDEIIFDFGSPDAL
jgi:hypothetical protein